MIGPGGAGVHPGPEAASVEPVREVDMTGSRGIGTGALLAALLLLGASARAGPSGGTSGWSSRGKLARTAPASWCFRWQRMTAMVWGCSLRIMFTSWLESMSLRPSKPGSDTAASMRSRKG